MDSKSGYAQTKIISEILVSKAAENFGIPVRIFRIGSISGDTQTRKINPRDISSNVIAACGTIGASVKNATRNLRWIPVDFVARAVVSLSETPTSTGKIFHLCGTGPAFPEVVEGFIQQGYELKSVTAAEWSSLVEAKVTEELSKSPENLNKGKSEFCLNVIKHVLPNPEDFFKSVSRDVPMEKTKGLLAQLGIEVPEIPIGTICAHLKFMYEENFMPSPQKK
jgi:thioester reductase-like protein